MNTRRCKPVSEGGCDKEYPLEEFPGSNRTDEHGKKRYVHGYWCRDCYNRRNRKNAKKIEARRKVCTDAQEANELARLYFCTVAPTPLGIELRAERAGEGMGV